MKYAFLMFSNGVFKIDLLRKYMIKIHVSL